MRILLLSVNSGGYGNLRNCYNGLGWSSSLQGLLEMEPGVELALAFPTSRKMPFRDRVGKTVVYPLPQPERSAFQKLAYYYGGYRTEVFEDRISEHILKAVGDFNPDLIHIFGTESELPYIIEKTSVPCAIHLQGLLGAYYKAYFPQGVDERAVKWNASFKRELLFRNGIVFNYHEMGVRAVREASFIRNCRYFLGRTQWDRESLGPDFKGRYFHVNEVLRPDFYSASKWKGRSGKLSIVSTISDTIYKGYDQILLTASILKNKGIDFRWNVIGASPEDSVTKVFERVYGIRHEDVNVGCLGMMEPREIISLLQKASVYVHPSHIDNSPNSLCEAQYLGVPALAFAVGGVPSLMKSSPESLVPDNDHEALAELLCAGKAGIQLDEAVERHDRRRILDSQMSAYEDILNEGNAG